MKRAIITTAIVCFLATTFIGCGEDKQVQKMSPQKVKELQKRQAESNKEWQETKDAVDRAVKAKQLNKRSEEVFREMKKAETRGEDTKPYVDELERITNEVKALANF